MNPPRCFDSHKPLIIKPKVKILGGSCLSPPSNMDILIGFDYGMEVTEFQYPWTAGKEFLYEIKDHQAPSDIKSFRKLIDYIQMQLLAGKKIHCGCIGGHGRTGTVFAALVKQMTGVEDAITFVRDNYCAKIVESKAQVTFLHKHYGIKEVSAYTKVYAPSRHNSYWESDFLPTTGNIKPIESWEYIDRSKKKNVTKGTLVLSPDVNQTSIFG